jgi:O-antigen/teichoic acid export membrane protein
LLAVFFETGGAIITALLSLWLVRKRLSGPLIRIDIGNWAHLFWEGLPLGLVLIFNVIYFRIDLFLLSYFRQSSEVGAYGLAYKFFELAIALPTFIMNSWYPLLLQARALGVVNRIGNKTYVLLAVLGLLVGVSLWIGAPFIVFRSDFVASVGLLRILSFSLPLFFVTSPLMWQFVLDKKQHLLVWVYAGATVINVLLNTVYIPIYGAFAAAVITGITELTVLGGGVAMLWWGRRKV